MDIILTHEQADFDALASALGAQLMNERAYAIAPRHMNRNVRSFLTLYGAGLPFVEARDLPAEPIATVTLVDTQSLVTIKGMSPQTAVQVVDHHPLRPELPETWNITIDPVGACTTLFVEGLRERDGAPSVIQATLLLLGIYEDTGSLTYTNTTPRDIRAAALLLEQGASLQLVSRYLNPPLSDEQRQVYDRLLASAERDLIHGHTVLIACAEAYEMTDEISTIAHKLRDLVDPDGLFLLVQTNEGIRLVARSTTDSIDVARIAEHFGGGGHGRAATALVRVTDNPNRPTNPPIPTLEELRRELIQILPEMIQPSYTVGQMMSHGPLVLTPHTSAEQAAQLMQRYGYEGYPVVVDGKVCGLLTRRAVDRALAHKLNLSAASLMESGEITVQPQDSIEHVRRLMIESGWGQIPVIDPDSKQVIGIVTRTDLLKTMSDTIPNAEYQNLAGQLEAALPAARLALLKAIAAQSYAQHAALYIVGGFVRDLLLSRPSPDFDIVVEGDAITLAKTLANQYGGRLLSHGRFGTAKWDISGARARLTQALAADALLRAEDLPDSLDLISARTEFYDYPTALPTVERSSIKLDLHRRDFTINTMALRLDGRHYGELYDHWGGMRDLRRGLVRVLHSLSFVDDPTRMIRAVRFEQRFGFQIEERTRQLIEEARPLVRQVSGDRLRHELCLVLAEDHAEQMLARLQELQLLSAIHPALHWSADNWTVIQRAMQAQPKASWDLPTRLGSLSLRDGLVFFTWFRSLPLDETSSIIQRLRLPNELQKALQALQQLRAELPDLLHALPSQVTFQLDLLPRFTLYGMWLSDPSAEARSLLEKYITTWQRMQSATTGNDLRALGIPPGPQYRLILNQLRSAWLDGDIHSPVEEQKLLQRLTERLIDP